MPSWDDVNRIALALPETAERPSHGQRSSRVADEPEVFFTAPHFDGYAAVLVQLERIGPPDLEELIAGAWGSARHPNALPRLTSANAWEPPTDTPLQPDGTSIAFQVHGEGPLDLVFVPGSSPTSSWSGRSRRSPASCAARLLLAPDRLRQARPGPVGRGARRPGGVDGRPRRRHGGRRDRAGGDLRDLRGRADVGALRRDPPQQGLLARPLRDLRADAQGAGLPTGHARGELRKVGRAGAGAMGWTGRCRLLGADRSRQPRVQALVESIAAPGDEPRRRDRPDGALPRDRRAQGAAGGQGADVDPASCRGPLDPRPARGSI